MPSPRSRAVDCIAMKFVLACAALFGLGLSFDARQESEGPEWHDDLDAAFTLATETGKPLLLVFR